MTGLDGQKGTAFIIVRYVQGNPVARMKGFTIFDEQKSAGLLP